MEEKDSLFKRLESDRESKRQNRKKFFDNATVAKSGEAGKAGHKDSVGRFNVKPVKVIIDESVNRIRTLTQSTIQSFTSNGSGKTLRSQ